MGWSQSSRPRERERGIFLEGRRRVVVFTRGEESMCEPEERVVALEEVGAFAQSGYCSAVLSRQSGVEESFSCDQVDSLMASSLSFYS